MKKLIKKASLDYSISAIVFICSTFGLGSLQAQQLFTTVYVDDDYDENDFEDILEIKGVHDHQKLIEMLDAVNNEFMHINDVVNTYFDRDNFVTWLALNIITDNVDTQSRNYYM